MVLFDESLGKNQFLNWISSFSELQVYIQHIFLNIFKYALWLAITIKDHQVVFWFFCGIIWAEVKPGLLG